jgi:aminoglycoside 6'-N-acetyltransferase
MNLYLRPANINDLKVLEFWDTQAHVISADPDDEWNWAEELLYEPSWREQLMAEIDGKPIGFIQIIDPAEEESHYWGEIEPNLRAIDIWIGEAENLGRGYGTQMMKLAIERCFVPANVEAILIDPLESNHKAQRFYERLGFKFVENRTFGLDNCRVYRLNRAEYK